MAAQPALTESAFPALVLNADFRPQSVWPLSTMPWQDAVHNVIAGDVVVVAEYDRTIRSQKIEMRLPSVIALKTFVQNDPKVAYTRANILMRDDFTCMYCGVKALPRDLTFDHVVPRSKGGRSTFENIVSACVPCNSRKRDMSIEEAGMRLRCSPAHPTRTQMQAKAQRYQALSRKVHVSWRDFLYWDTELQE